MPRDLIREAEIQTKPDLSKPSLEGLAWLLRHPEEWRARWTWDFSLIANDCGTAGCAIGLGEMFWGHGFLEGDWGTNPQKLFSAGQHDKQITPLVVASRIDDCLAGRPIRYLVEGDRG